jgi:hypothetical protein
MTITDRLIPYYYWFKYGYAELMIPVAIVNITFVAITLITVKGISIPLWLEIGLPISAGIACIVIGWFMQRYNITARVNSVANLYNNAELRKIYDDVDYIRKYIEENKK